jgi:hypothetical protein
VLFSKRLKNLIESGKKYWRMKLKKISLGGVEETQLKESKLK